MKQTENNRTARDVQRVLDRHAAADDYELTQFSENISLFLKTQSPDLSVPRVSEPTLVAGSWAKQIARCGMKVVVEPLDDETHAWLKSGDEGNETRDTLHVADTGVKFMVDVVLIRDVLWSTRGDDDLTSFVEQASSGLGDDVKLVFDTASPTIGKTVTEIGGVNIVRSYVKTRSRVVKHTLVIRDSENGHKIESEINTWRPSDVYAACKRAGFKPGPVLPGQDASRFVTYVRS